MRLQLPPQTQSARDKLEGRLLLFGKPIMPAAFWAPPSIAHYTVEEMILDTESKRNNLILPRGLAKSTLVGEVHPIYHIMYEFPDVPKMIVILSKTQSHSIDRLRAIKNVFDYQPLFTALFGHWGQHSAKEWRENSVILKDGSKIVARGTGQPIRGIKSDYMRPTLIIGDDLEDENNTKTDEAMHNNLIWLLQGAEYALDPRYGRVNIIGTPIHQNLS